MNDAVRKKSAPVDDMSSDWTLVSDLLGGTKAMRKAGKAHLPKWPGESDDAYAFRLNTSTLFNAFKRTVDVLGAKPFSKPLTIGDNVPSRIKDFCEDIDLQGRNLHAFAAGVTLEALSYGISGILVDYPKAKGLKTQADEVKAGVRPYWVHIHPSQILGWRASQESGKWQLKQLRILEQYETQDGDYGENTAEQIRILTPGAWEIWRHVESKWVLHERGVTSLKVIPYVPVYGGRIAFMKAVPPLLDLAYLNIKHWQSQSDQDTILHVARVPILALIGVPDDVTISVGASTALRLSDPQAKAVFVEHTGKSIEAGRMSLLDLEDRMRQTGAELLVIKPGNITEAQTVADNEPGMCTLQRIAEDVEDALDQALQLTAEWINESSGGNVTLFKDFGAATLAEASAELLLKANQAGKISDETFLGELKRRGIIAPELDIAEERERIDSQPPPLGVIDETNTGPNKPQQKLDALLQDGDD